MTFQTFFIWVGVVLNENEKKREKKFNTMCISQSKFKVTSVVIESEWQKRSRLKQMTGFYMECDIGLSGWALNPKYTICSLFLNPIVPSMN